jgi:hypothetical protein
MKNPTSSQSEIVEKTSSEVNDLEEMKKQLAEQSKLIDMLLKKNNKAGRPVKDTEKYHDIRPDEYVTIMSLNNKPLNISSKPRFQGKTLSFTYFGETKQVLYSEFLDIKENHKNFFEQGKFYLLDEGRGIIEKLGYGDFYAHILTKDKIEAILNSTPEAFNFFQSANKAQQEMIINMLVIKMRDGQNVDRNLVANISRYSGIDLEARVKKALDDIEYEEGLKNLSK